MGNDLPDDPENFSDGTLSGAEAGPANNSLQSTQVPITKSLKLDNLFLYLYYPTPDYP
jgi:hypothetical protein